MLLRKLFSIILIIMQGFLLSCGNDRSQPGQVADAIPTDNAYIGPDACKSCHAVEYADWMRSDHFKAMMTATDSSVSGDFNNAVLAADGVTSRFFRKDGKFFINTQGDDGRNHDYEVKYTFGYYPLQQYLVEFPGGRLQVPRTSYNVVQKKWYHQYAGQRIHPRDWLHWTKQSQNWNSMCASCHSTNLQRNYNETTDSYHTTWSHLNVSCESCHGMGKSHVDYIQTQAYREGNKVAGSYLALHKGQKNTEQLGACVQCHARRMEVSAAPAASAEALEHFIPMTATSEIYFADGQFREEAYEFGSFTQSKMYHRGVSCKNCHNPHSGNLVAEGNALCMQCHQTKYDSPLHTFHVIGSEASQCVNCHMPVRTYMGADVRRDHSFRIPRPDQSVKYGTPNACNGCHSDKRAKWAAAAVVNWYGPVRKYHYSDDLVPGSMLNDSSYGHLHRLLEDTASTDMIRATAIHYLGEILTPESLADIRKFLGDSSALVRSRAAASLVNFPPANWVGDLSPLLNDRVRGVRISAAQTFTAAPKEVLEKYNMVFSGQSQKELLDFLHLQADFTTGNIALGDYYYNSGDPARAESYYLHALRIDSVANYARLKLSSLYNARSQNDKALTILNEALVIDPGNPRITYNLALLYVELGDARRAFRNFDRTAMLNGQTEQYYANYALFSHQQGKASKAKGLYREGLQRYPFSERLNYGAAWFYIQSGENEKAMSYIRRLKELNPGQPEYAELFRLLQ